MTQLGPNGFADLNHAIGGVKGPGALAVQRFVDEVWPELPAPRHGAVVAFCIAGHLNIEPAFLRNCRAIEETVRPGQTVNMLEEIRNHISDHFPNVELERDPDNCTSYDLTLVPPGFDCDPWRIVCSIPDDRWCTPPVEP